jgi:2-polyprenyl-3-methyl-5-hydroxy-6-metoxy-1,4-benzoquinol methylase
MNSSSERCGDAAHSARVEPVQYVESRRTLFARFSDGSLVQVARSRARSYPGLASEAPPTAPIYEVAARELAAARTVVDLGCGSGLGTRILAESLPDVVGVDTDDSALDFARLLAPAARFAPAGMFDHGALGAMDGATAVDVLGHVESPFAMLLQLRACLAPGSCIVLAEPSGYPGQSLSSPARRAFSVHGLEALLSASSFAVRDWIWDDGTFLACVAEAVDDGGADALIEGTRFGAAGNLAAAIRSYRVASVSPRAAVQREAQLSLADTYLAQRDGDAACRAYFRAREIDPSDARPLAGLAQVALAMGHIDDARVLCTKAIELDPVDVTAAGVFAMTVEAATPNEALASWRIVNNLAPDNLQFAVRLSEAALRRSEPNLALHVLDRLRGYGDDHGAALHVAMASALKAAGRVMDARLEARMALARAPQEPDVVKLCRELQP